MHSSAAVNPSTRPIGHWLKIAFRLFVRELGRGELTIIALSLILAVSSVMALSSVTDRVDKAIMSKGASFLAADKSLSSAHPLDSNFQSHAEELGLKTDSHIYFRSMAFAEEEMSIAIVKAVTESYPLRGDLIIARDADMLDFEIRQGPKSGEVWLSKRLFFTLGLDEQRLVDKDYQQIEIGDLLVSVTGIINAEPDAPFEVFDSGTRIIMNIADVPATNVIQPGSRISYKYLFAGSAEQLEQYEGWLKPQLKPNQRLIDVTDREGGVSDALNRAESFLMLAGILGVLLAATAVAVAAKLFSQRHLDSIAIFKTLGASIQQVRVIYLFQLVLIAVASIVVGTLAGLLIQSVAVSAMAEYLPANLPPIGLKPLVMAVVTGFVCALMFSVPSLLKLFGVPPLRVLRRNLGDDFAVSNTARLIMAITTILLVYMYSLDLKITGIIMAAGAVLVVVILLAAKLMFYWSRKVSSSVGGSALKIALASLKRRASENTSQLIGFTLAIMLILILYALENSIIQEWQEQIPEGTPNHFVLNIADHELEQVEQAFTEQDIIPEQYYPVIRGRLVKINDEAVKQPSDDKEQQQKESGAKLAEKEKAAEQGAEQEGEQEQQRSEGRRGIGRELNLTFTTQFPENNEIVEGSWMPEGQSMQVSIELETAKRLDVTLNDKLSFLIGAKEVSATITSIRTVDWNSFQPNFFMIFTPDVLADFPATYFTSFHIPKDKKLWLNQLLKQYPTLSIIDIEAMIAQIQEVIGQVSLSIRFVLIVVIFAATLVLLAQVQSSLDERRKETVIYRTLGAKGSLIQNAISLEFLSLGAIAGLIAAIVAEFSLFLLQWQMFDMDWVFHWQIWLIGPISGAVFVALVGSLSTRSLLKMTPNQMIRQLS